MRGLMTTAAIMAMAATTAFAQPMQKTASGIDLYRVFPGFVAETRDEQGTQTPLQTLARGSGSCRDYALLMMEAARRLGVATRFVSGYLYDAALDDSAVGSGEATTGAGATHAWLQAYLPGAGWVAYDPTNNLLGGSQLIRVAVARDPAFAAPVSGSWYGERDAYEGLDATVQVKRRPG